MQRREKSHEWLNQLGRQSWNLELLISGFSIILLIQGNQVAEEKLTLFLNHTEFNDSIFMLVLKTYLRFLQIGVTALLYNLIIHLILRGLWIGAIGLRTVNQGTDLLKLGYTPFFCSVLRKNTPGLDRYIINLDKYCSSIFAFSYLIVFVALCIGIYFGLLAASSQALFWLFTSTSGSTWLFVTGFWNMLVATISIVYLIDFAFLGPMKKVEGLDRIYYPFYKFLSWISLSFIYRPLYYTMLGKRFSRRFIWFIVPFFILLFIGDTVGFRTQPYIPKSSNSLTIEPNYYDDLLKGLRIHLASTPSRYVREGALEVFIPLNMKELDAKIKKHCPGIQPMYQTQLKSTVFTNDVDYKWIQSNNQVASYHTCCNYMFQIQVDSTIIESTPFFHQHPKTTQYGLLHIIDIDSLPRGVHQINIGRIDSKKTSGQDSVFYRPYALFPVWKI